MIKGSLVALVTPMDAGGKVDDAKLAILLQQQIDAGTAAIVVAGTTGEAATLSVNEHADLIAACVKHCAGAIDVVAGIGANSTSEAIDLAQMAKQCGAQSGLAVPPYYVRPNQLGIVRHFEAVAAASNFPQILYNIPGRTAVDIQDSTILALADNPLFVGLKDATSDMVRAVNIISAAPAHFACYSGDDATTLAFMLMGGHGTISVAANVVPETVARLCALALDGKVAEARDLNARLLPLYRALSLDTNPIPVKYAMAHLKLMGPGLRLPLVELDEQRAAQLRTAFAAMAPKLPELARLLDNSGAL